MRTNLPIAALISCLVTSHAAALDIISCGQMVPAGEEATLVADLDCSTSPGVCLYGSPPDNAEIACTSDAYCASIPYNYCIRQAVVAGKASHILLSGHTLTGGAIDCRKGPRCTIDGPGEIVGAAVGVWIGRRALLRDLTVRDGEYGVFAVGKVLLEGVTVTGNHAYGVIAYGGVQASHVVASGNGLVGLYASRTSVKGVSVTANNNSGNGVDGTSTRIHGLIAQGNGGIGAAAERGVSLWDSVVTGNNGVDVQSGSPPRLTNTVCGTSFNSTGGGSWGVCAND